jgi:hypothetical protein
VRSADTSDRITAHIVESIGRAAPGGDPFPHLELRDFFPADVYAAMLEAMPSASAYRPMSGRAREARLADGSPTRTKLHLLPEFIRGMQPSQRDVWRPVGRALCSAPVRDAFVRRLAPGLQRRFGDDYAKVGLYPIPMLTRDVTGYRIGIHPDTRHKGITVQLYLPRDESIRHVGTAFHRRRKWRSCRTAATASRSAATPTIRSTSSAPRSTRAIPSCSRISWTTRRGSDSPTAPSAR